MFGDWWNMAEEKKKKKPGGVALADGPGAMGAAGVQQQVAADQAKPVGDPDMIQDAMQNAWQNNLLRWLATNQPRVGFGNGWMNATTGPIFDAMNGGFQNQLAGAQDQMWQANQSNQQASLARAALNEQARRTNMLGGALSQALGGFTMGGGGLPLSDLVRRV